MTTKTVKLLGSFDFKLTVITLVFIAVQILIPLYLNIQSTTPATTKLTVEFPKQNEKQSETGHQISSLKLWFIGLLFVTIGLMGLSWSLVLIRGAGIRSTPFEVRVQLQDRWLLSNILIAALMIAFGILAFSNGSSEIDNSTYFYTTKIPYLIIILMRLILMYQIWTETNQMVKDGERTNDAIERWIERKNNARRNQQRRPRYEETAL